MDWERVSRTEYDTIIFLATYVFPNYILVYFPISENDTLEIVFVDLNVENHLVLPETFRNLY